MKAITFQSRKKVLVKEVNDPKIINDDDIIIKVTSTAICGSDLHIYNGLIPIPEDYIIGHEAMGIVVELGKGVKNLKKGDRVIVPFPVSCGHCFYCEHDLWSQCDNSNHNAEIGGIFGFGELLGGYDGGQAEYLRVPYANVGPKKIEENYKDEEVLFLTDILPTSYWAVENGNIKEGDTVVVLGCGPVGLLAQKWAYYKGADRVIAVDLVNYRLEHAQKFNKVETYNLEEYDNVGEEIKELTHGGADCVIDCVGMDGKLSMFEKLETLLKLQGGSKSAIEIASQAVRKGGTVSIVGVYGSRYNNFPLGDFFSRNITLKMGQCPVHKYVDHILNIIKYEKINPTDIITHVLPLNKGEYAYKIFANKLDNCIKVILKP
ncbi:MAG TPA: zinc-dependent alcohol dehydrogenase [Haloplasmataceae bacterium]